MNKKKKVEAHYQVEILFRISSHNKKKTLCQTGTLMVSELLNWLIRLNIILKWILNGAQPWSMLTDLLQTPNMPADGNLYFPTCLISPSDVWRLLLLLSRLETHTRLVMNSVCFFFKSQSQHVFVCLFTRTNKKECNLACWKLRWESKLNAFVSNV